LQREPYGNTVDNPHFLTLAAETGVLKFKEQTPSKFEKQNTSGSTLNEGQSIETTFITLVNLAGLYI
jgi:hypothetical protein